MQMKNSTSFEILCISDFSQCQFDEDKHSSVFMECSIQLDYTLPVEVFVF